MGIAGQQLNARLCSPEVVKQFLGEMMELAGSLHGPGRKGFAAMRIFLWKMRARRKKMNEIIGFYVEKVKKK
jgi:hypothetical protein